MTRIRSNRFRSRRKRSHMNRLQAAAISRGFVLSLAVLVPVLTFAAWTVFGKDRRETKQPSASAAYAPDAPMESSSLPAAPAVTVHGVDLTGLDRSAAEKKLTEAFSWDVSVVWENDRLPFPNPLEPEIRRILDEIYAAGQFRAELQFDFSREDFLLQFFPQVGVRRAGAGDRRHQMQGTVLLIRPGQANLRRQLPVNPQE